MSKTLRIKSPNINIIGFMVIIGLFVLSMSGCQQVMEQAKSNSGNTEKPAEAPKANTNSESPNTNANSESPKANTNSETSKEPDVSGLKVESEFSGGIGEGSNTPAEGDQIEFGIHARQNDEPNAPKGTKYMLLKIVQNGKALAAPLNMPLQEDQEFYKEAAGRVLNKGTINKVENPIAMRPYDNLKVTFYENEGSMADIEVTRGGKSQGRMRIRWTK